MEGFINKLKNNIKFRKKYLEIINTDNIENDIIGLRGLYFGYPKCCIRYYIKNKDNLPQICLDVSENYGFIPCEICSRKIFDKKIRLHNLINKRVCKVRFLDYQYKDDNTEIHKYIEYYLKIFNSELDEQDNTENKNTLDETNYKIKINPNNKKILKYFPQYCENDDFIKRIVKIDGKYWGYPLCCVKYFIENTGYDIKTESICQLSKQASGSTGFYPCPIHALHIIDKFIKIEDLIKKNRKSQEIFPNENLKENSNYLLKVLSNSLK